MSVFIYPPISVSTTPPVGAATSANQLLEIADLDAINASNSSIDSKIVTVNTGAVVVASSALPSGASTSALQNTGNTSLGSIDSKIVTVNTGAVVVSSSALPTGAATETTLGAMSAKLPSTIGTKTSAASLGVVLASDQAAVPVTLASSPLPTGGATSANQALEIADLDAIKISAASMDFKLVNLTNGLQKTQQVDGSGNIAELYQAAGHWNQLVTTGGTSFFFSTTNSSTAQLAASATFTGGIESTQDQQAISVLLVTDQPGTFILNQYIDIAGTKKTNSWTYSIAAGVPFSRSFTANGNYYNSTFQNTGGSTTTTFNLNTAFGTLPATTNLGNGNVSLDEMGGVALTTGQKAAASSVPVTLSNENVQDLYITGQSVQTALINNVLTSLAGASAVDATGYRSVMVQVVSTGTAGAYIFEGSNDNTNFQTIPVYSQGILTGTAITAAITATASQLGYIFPVNFRYIRLRISTAITGGSIQAFSKFMQTSYAPGTIAVSQSTAANLNANIGTLPALTAGANVIGNVGVGVVAVIDQASAAITTTTTGAAKLITNGASVSFTVNATVVSGTTPTYDFKVQESNDGTIWTDIWAAQRLTAVSSFITPAIRIRGTQYRYVETISGTTPSFTRTISTARIPHAGELIRNIVDRTIAPITTSSVTPTLYAEGCSYITLTVAQGAGGTAVIFAVDGSMDGTNWILGIKQVAGIVSGFSQGSASASFKFFRARVVTGVAATTINYIVLEAKETPIDDAVNQNAVSSGTTALTTVVTATPPAGAVGFILQCDGIVANAMRWRAGGLAATTSSGYILQPGQDTGYIPGAPTLSLISVAGTSGYNLEWILK